MKFNYEKFESCLIPKKCHLLSRFPLPFSCKRDFVTFYCTEELIFHSKQHFLVDDETKNIELITPK